MMRKEIFVMLCMCVPVMGFAQEETDTLATQQLHEIVVKAPKVVRKADMDMYYPSKSAVEYSKDGVELLRNLSIPSLNVNDVLGTVTASGQSVQFRINGREATIDQVRNLLPETVRRVEWIDNPGLRYNGANGVLNFIVSNPDAGGSLMTHAMQALNCAWGPYNAALKLNNGYSQWGASANFKLTNKIGSHREYNETFVFPDGERLTRNEKSLGGYMDATFGGVQLDYSYVRPDTTVLWVALYASKDWPAATCYRGLMSENNGADEILLRDYSGKKGFTPSLQLYLEQHFAHDQVMAIDFNTSFYAGHTFRTYTEENAVTFEKITDVNTSIKDRNQVYGIEADYIKNWKNSRFTAGVSYTANRNRSVYENLDGEVFHQKQDKVYAFAEYFHRIDKVTLTAGIGMQYTSFKTRETSQGSTTWNARPQFTATYSLNQASQFRLNFTTWQSAPSLAQTNVAPQQIDALQWQIGNPDLKTSSSYMLTLRYNYNFNRIMGSFGVRAFTSPDAITPLIRWRDNILVTTYENSMGLQNLSFFLSPQIVAIPDWLTLNGTLQYRAERMRGDGYSCYNHNWSGDITAMLQHWGFTLTAQYVKAQSDLWGESISWGETLSILALSYDWKKWEFTAGALCPFTKYDRGSRSLNKYHQTTNHLRLDMAPMPFLQIRYNLQWGRQKRNARKLVNADADVQTSDAAGR